MEEYLKPTPTIDCDARSIKETAQYLTNGQKGIADKAKCLFCFVRDEIKYNPYSPFHLLEHYRASNILSRREGYCVQKAVLLATLARAVSIPARLRFADIQNYIVPQKLAEILGTNLFTYHGYTELHIGGRWIKATPAFDQEMCLENRIIAVEFDGKNHAILHTYNQDGKLHIKYIRDRGYYSDIPLDNILNAWVQVYGSHRVEWFKMTFGRTREH